MSSATLPLTALLLLVGLPLSAALVALTGTILLLATLALAALALTTLAAALLLAALTLALTFVVAVLVHRSSS
jgi:hypothetical protein